MNPSIAGSVFYESRFPRWLDELTTQLDYFWFVALLAWTFVLVLWIWHPRRKELSASAWAWLPWSAAAGLLATGLEFLLINSDGNPSNHVGPVANFLVGFLPMLAAAGWWWQASAGRGRWWRFAAALSLLPLAAIAGVRYYNPLVLAWWTVGAALIAAVPWLLRADATVWSRIAVWLAALCPLASNIGPPAILWRLSGPLVPQNAATLMAGLCQALAGGVALAGLAREAWRALPPATRRNVWPELRPFVFAGALWAAGLLVFGAITSEQQREAGSRFSLEQVHRVALQLDPRQLAAILGPQLQLDPASLPPADEEPRWPPLRLARAPSLANGSGEPVARVLFDVARASRGGLRSVNILTLRDGWLVVAISSLRFGPPGVVRLARPADDWDQARWEHHAEYVDLAVGGNNGGFDFIRFPLTAPDGAMLGWLEFAQVRGGNAAMRARTAPFVGSVLGLVVAALFFVQRRTLRAEEAALRAAAVAAEAARVKTEFIAKVSHELRTPLQNILGYGELLQPAVADEPARARLAALRQNSASMLRLVDDLLDLSAMEAGGFRFVEKPVALADLVRETIASLQPRADAKGLALACEIAPDFPPWLVTDGERFRQIVVNLAGNAVKFTARGRVDVALSVVARSTDDACLIELVVRDTGPGIAEAERSRLFQPFSRLELTSQQEGRGLGLALTAALCRGAGGALALESDGRTGACFRARWRARPAPSPVAEPSPTSSLPPVHGRRILIADDNLLVRDLFAALLRDLGAVCETVADGEAALAQVRERAFDAIVLDLAMPRLDGLAVARELRASGQTARIVGVSAHALGGDREQALAAGMDAFLTKPVDLSSLAAALGAGPAPKISASRHKRLRAEFAARFRAEVADAAAAVRDALAQRDWPALHARTHHLKGSAGVVGDEKLYAACGALEDAAEARAAAAADAAWRTCETALAPWLQGKVERVDLNAL